MTSLVRVIHRRTAIAAAAGIPLLLGGCDAILPRQAAPPAESPAAAAPTPPAAAPVRPKTAGTAPAIDESAAFAAARNVLRRLVIAEETYFAENGTYTSNLDQVRFRSPAGVTVTMLWATRDGWAARASHAQLRDRDCVVYVGLSRPAPATTRYRRQAGEGVPVCDSPGSVSRPVPPTSRRAAALARDTASALDLVSPIVQMKVDLRNLARSQELWFGTQGAYSRRVEPFAMQFLWHRGVALRIISADRHSWSAKATHAALPGRSCVISYGPLPTPLRTDAQQREPTRAAVPVCDEPS